MSKINFLLKNIPNIITGFMPQLARGLRRNTNRQVRLRRPTFYNVNNRRRRRRNQKNNGGFEINHADGGLKQNYSKQQTRLVPINCFGRLMAVKEGTVVTYKMQLLSDSYAFNSDNINLQTELNRAGEFIEWRRFSSQYKVKGINTTINFNYHQGQGDYLPRLLMMYNTDTIETTNLNYENNAMNLDLTKVGTKNYNLRLNKRNMLEDNVDWINSDTSYGGKINLLVSQQDNAYFGSDNEYRILGTVKFTFNVIFRLRDVQVLIGNKLFKKAKGVNEYERELDESDFSVSTINHEVQVEKKEEEEKEQNEITTSESGTQCSMYDNISLKPFYTKEIYSKYGKAIDIAEKANRKEVFQIRDLMLDMLREYDEYMKEVVIQFTKLINFLPNEIDEKQEIKCGIKNFTKEFEYLKQHTGVASGTIEGEFRNCQVKIMLHITSNGKKYLWSERDEYAFKDIVQKLMTARKIETNAEYEKVIRKKKKNNNKKNKKKKRKNKNVKDDIEEIE